jgi:hypothetical protein
MSVREPSSPGGEDPAVRPDEPEAQLSDEEEIKAARQANRFDIRRIIGGVFLVYGILLTVMGVVGSHHIKTRADGINIDLWTGIGMLVFAALMLVWAFARPVMPEPPDVRGRGSGRIRRAPAT